MDNIRKFGLFASITCVILAITVWVSAKLGIGNETSLFSLVSCLCGAAVFFVAPYTIIPATAGDPSKNTSGRWMVQLFTSGFYLLTLLILLLMSSPAITNAADTAGSADNPLVIGLFVLGLSFLFSLASHFLSVAASLLVAIKQAP